MKEVRKTEKKKTQPSTRTKNKTALLEQLESEWQRVAGALRRSETMFRKITEKSIVGVYLIQDEKFRYINPKMAEIVGYEVDELVDVRGPHHVVLPEDWPQVEENLRKRMAGEVEAIHYRFRGIKSSEEIIHIEVYGSRTDYQGRPAVIGTILDITERVEAERNLQSQLHRFQVLYHIALAMAAEHTLEENLALIVDKCRQLLAADVSLIAVSEESLARMILCAQSGLRRAELEGTPMEFLKKQQVNACLEKAGDDAEALFAMLQAIGKNEFRDERLSSGIAIPLRMSKATIGIFCVGSRSTRAFSEFERDSLSLIGNIAALEITRKRAEERVAQSESQLRLLSKQLLRAQEDERRRLAQELHDGIGQSLSAIKFKIESSMKPIAGIPSRGSAAALETLVSMIQSTVEEVQRIAMDLRPFILDDLGLIATLRWFLRQFQSTYSTLKVEGRIAIKETDIPESLKIVIFRIVQEALNNVAKHSHADRVQFALRKRNNRIELLVNDNGVGMDGTSVSNSGGCGKGFGIASMKERAEFSGGRLLFETDPIRGTSVAASWPYKGPAIGK